VEAHLQRSIETTLRYAPQIQTLEMTSSIFDKTSNWAKARLNSILITHGINAVAIHKSLDAF